MCMLYWLINLPSLGYDNHSVIVKNDEMLVIDSDLGTAKHCHKVKEPHNCSNLTDLIIRNSKDET